MNQKPQSALQEEQASKALSQDKAELSDSQLEQVAAGSTVLPEQRAADKKMREYWK
ncbi:hypothetical protein DLREEDagrD3_11510 [Denitratisoma sp. agr-D3]